MIDLSIIIVSWNSRKDLEGCLLSLAAALQTHAREVMLVDNASEDSSVETGRRMLPDMRIIQNRANLGFAVANNQAIALAAGRYLCLLNPDTVLRENALDVLVDFMDLNPGAYACGPGMLNSDGSPQRTGVRFPTLWNLCVESLFLDRLFPHSRVFGRHRELYEQALHNRQVDFVQGSCLLVRRDIVGRIGGLDEGFFMYFEETDWCYRMKRAGGEIWLVPDAAVVHLGGDAMGHFDERRLVFYHRSLLRFFGKHHTLGSRVALRMILLGRSLLRIIVWGFVAVFGHENRAAAYSSCRGYRRVALELLRIGR